MLKKGDKVRLLPGAQVSIPAPGVIFTVITYIEDLGRVYISHSGEPAMSVRASEIQKVDED